MNFSKKKCLKRVVLQNVTVIHDVRIRPDVRKNILRKIYFIMIFFFSNIVTRITSLSDNYCSYDLNSTSFIFPSDVIYLGGRIHIFGLYI